jgi:two-component system, NarL family, sensor kinase
VLRDSPGNRLGPLFAAIGLWFGVGGFCGALRGGLDPSSLGYALCSVVNGLWLVVVPALFLIPVLYPDGRPLTARWRIPARVVAGCIVATAVGSLLAPEITESESGSRSAVNPFGVAALAPAPLVVALLAVLISVCIGIAALIAQMLRARALEGDERARIGWLMAFFAAQMVAFLFSGAPNLAVQLLAAVCLGIGVLRHHLFDIQRVLSRSVTYALLVAVAMAVAVATAAAMGSLSSIGVLPALVAAVTAVVLASWLAALERVVDRWVYGPRHNPAEALQLLGDRLAAAADPDDVLPRVVDTVRESLGLPYAALVLAGETTRAAAAGTPEGPTVSYPLRYGGQVVGELELGLRVGDEELNAREARLVSTFAAQAGTAAHSAQMLRELRRSREQLVTAREEERRMLRRDLHDGLGPTLAGMTLGLESLQRGSDDPGEAALAAELVAQSRLALDAVRWLSCDLRPPPLDELGLTATSASWSTARSRRCRPRSRWRRTGSRRRRCPTPPGTRPLRAASSSCRRTDRSCCP